MQEQLKPINHTYNRRSWVVLAGFLAVAFMIIARLFQIQILENAFYREKALDQRMKIIDLSPPRGDIYDRNGKLFATTVDSSSVFIIPTEIVSKEYTAKRLSEILSISYADLIEKCKSRRSFVWAKRKLDDPLALKVKKAGLSGVYFQTEKKRIYPRQTLASQVIGFVGMDNQGLAGIEQSLDKYLRGIEGKIITEKDPQGREILSANQRVLQEQTYGMNVELTLDEAIQFFTENAVESAVKRHHASLGMAIVMDTQSGEILAMAGYPDFDPNEYKKSPMQNWQTMPVSFVYEPGSTFKVITAAAAIDSGAADEKTELKHLASINVGGRIIKNSHDVPKFSGRYSITISEMLQQSLNTGAVQLGLKMGKEKFYSYIRRFGFGDAVKVGLPSESSGIVHRPSKWYAPDIGMITFGQSIAVTPIQLISAVASIANGGQRMKPYIIRKIESLDGRFVKKYSAEICGQPIKNSTAAFVTGMMEDVTNLGSGKPSKIRYFRVASKTGTAQKPAPGGGYLAGHFIASHVAFMPASKPRIAILVIVDDPKAGTIWGETVAAPIIREIGEKTLRYLNIPPDNLS